MRRIALEVRQNSCATFVVASSALGTGFLFIFLNAIRDQTRVTQVQGQFPPTAEIAEVHLLTSLNRLGL